MKSSSQNQPGQLQLLVHRYPRDVGQVVSLRMSSHRRMRTGNFQRWPGTSDTVMHVHIMLYVCQKAFSRGILSKKELANVLGLIDDGVISIELEASVTEELAKSKAERFFELMIKTYKELGFEVDQVKTLFSTIKYAYLNQVFCDGAQAFFSLKTYLRAEVESKTWFDDVFQKMQSAFGAMLGTTKSGFDPWAAYIAAINLATDELLQRVPIAESIPPLVAAYLMLSPRSQGGWGMPTLVAWVTRESRDELSDHNHRLKEFCKMFTAAGIDVPLGIQKIIAAEKTNPWASETALCKNPFNKRREGVVSPNTIAAKHIAKAIRSMNLCPEY